MTSPTNGSAVQSAADRLRDRLVRTHDLREVGDPFDTLVAEATGEPAGSVRVWTGAAIPKLVDVRLVIESAGIDSVMLHAFAQSGSSVPHLTSDLAGLPGGINGVVDLAPRVDLSTESAYLDGVYAPLGGARDRALRIDGAQRIEVPLRLLAFTSPWITAVTVGDAALGELETVFDTYLDRFDALIAQGTPPVRSRDLAAQDAVRRSAQFDPASDVVWDLMAQLVGKHSTDLILDLLREPGPPREPVA